MNAIPLPFLIRSRFSLGNRDRLGTVGVDRLRPRFAGIIGQGIALDCISQDKQIACYVAGFWYQSIAFVYTGAIVIRAFFLG